jgi:GDP-4-dehydro-6-deoxy-D-mannose reductase
MSKTILVTGATGFVGSHLLDYLVEAEPDAKIVGMRRLNSNMNKVHHLGKKVEWFTGDICDQSSCTTMIGDFYQGEIYHLAACSWVSPSWTMPSIYMQTNAIGTINLFEAILERQRTPSKARVLVSCTPEEFGDVDPNDLPLTEDSPLAPVNPYAASKAAQDHICQSYFASYGIPIIRTRAFNHEGPRRDTQGALASFAYQIARIEQGLQDPIVYVGNTEAKRNFTHVKDMVRAYWLAMKHGAPGELYLIGSDYVGTIQACLNVLLSHSTRKDIQVKVDRARVRPTELRYLVADSSKFRDLTGWSPEIGFIDLMDDILNYWRQRVRDAKCDHYG